jgi:hypothetical protein
MHKIQEVLRGLFVYVNKLKNITEAPREIWGFLILGWFFEILVEN